MTGVRCVRKYFDVQNCAFPGILMCDFGNNYAHFISFYQNKFTDLKITNYPLKLPKAGYRDKRWGGGGVGRGTGTISLTPSRIM